MLSLSGTPIWTDITPAGPGPGPREGMAAIYDPIRGRMIVHGGWNFTPDSWLPGGGATTIYDDVWTLSLSGTQSWTQLAAAGPTPLGRFYQSAAYDPDLDRLLMCDGLTGSGAGVALADAWQLSLGATPTWSKIAVTGGPADRAGRSLVAGNGRATVAQWSAGMDFTDRA
jgi:hypothetical protein